MSLHVKDESVLQKNAAWKAVIFYYYDICFIAFSWKWLFCRFSLDSKIARNTELLANGGNILAQNQKVPSAWEPCVSSLAISHYLLHLSDQDMAAPQMFSQSDGWDRNSGRRKTQSQLSEGFDVSQGVCRLHRTVPLWLEWFSAIGDTPCRNQLLKKNMHIL